MLFHTTHLAFPIAAPAPANLLICIARRPEDGDFRRNTRLIDFKDYLKIETNQNTSIVKRQEVKKIDLERSKILLYFDQKYTAYSKHLEIVISSLIIDRNSFEVIKIKTEISELKTLIETKDYSDVYIVIDKSNDLINNLGQLDNYIQEINIETRITENASLSNLIMFVTQTKKYNYKRNSEVKK